MKRHLTIAAFACVSAAMLVGAASSAAKPRKTAAPAAPAFTLTDQDGKKVSLADFAGKVVVLEWINWECPFVKRHHQAGTMKDLAATYAPKGVVWLGVNSTKHHDAKVNRKGIATYKLPYPVLDDHAGTVGRLYAAKTTPHMFVIDKTGAIAYQGGIDDDPRGKMKGKATNHVAAALDDLLAGKAVSTPQSKPYGCSVKYAPQPAGAPAFTLADQDGKQVSLADFAGKVVVLEWINWECPFVKRHHQAGTMKKLAAAYAPKGVVWLGVNSTKHHDAKVNRKGIVTYKLPYPVLDDHAGKTGRLYAAKTTPHMFIIAKTGAIAYQGAIDDDPRGRKKGKAANYVAGALDNLLAGRAVSTPKTKPYGCSVKYAK